MHNKLKALLNIALVLLFIFFALSSITYAQDEVIRVNTNLVTIPTTVLDRNGHYVTDLRKEDFQVFEDGAEQEIAYFEPTIQPFTAFLLLDNSGSMRGQMANLARAANAFVDQLRPDDQLIVATFSDGGRMKVILEAAKKKDFRQKILLRARTNDLTTTTFNAVKQAIKYMKNFQGRRAIILFGDGELNGQGVTAKSNLRDAEEQEALIYTIRFGAFPRAHPGYETPDLDKKINKPLN